MDTAEMYELVQEAVAQALDEREGGATIRMSRRMIGGRILFEDKEGREARAIPVANLFKKVTSVREKLRVLEQKVNGHSSLDVAEKAELQNYITKCYGSLTTFNFLFSEDHDHFRGTGA